MLDRDDSGKLQMAVDSILANEEVGAFAEYWKLGKELMDGARVRAYYIRREGGYVNLAILTDNVIFDIENNANGAIDGVGAELLRSISAVYFHTGSLRTIPNSEKAQLTVVALRIGAGAPGLYWFAKTDSEREDLLRFGRALLNAVSAR